MPFRTGRHFFCLCGWVGDRGISGTKGIGLSRDDPSKGVHTCTTDLHVIRATPTKTQNPVHASANPARST